MPDAAHIPITVEDWNGIYARGVTDTPPKGFFLDSLNMKFNESDVFTRDGSTKIATIANITRFFVYKRLGETVRYIYLDNAGQLFDSLFPGVPIWTDASYVDFTMLNFNNRAYISPHNRSVGQPGKFLLVYDGTGTARLAGGAAPVGFTLTAVNSATAGNIAAGKHIFAVAFESSTGYITAPGPATFTVLQATGGFSATIGNLPALPSGMVAVRILTTKAIQDYNGNQKGYAFYFIPSTNGGRVIGGAASATVSFFDVELSASADYLFDNRGLIPAGVCICDYNGRLCIAGINGDEHSVYVSKPYDPEQVSAVSGTIIVDPFESGAGIRNLFHFRNTLIICKPNRMYSTIDNQSDPVTWGTPNNIDQGLGAECFGVGTILDSKGQQNDRSFIATRAGLILFEGYVRQPEASWLVEDIWDRINKVVFNLIQVCVDTERKQIYITLPLDGSATISHILYGFYGSAYEGGYFNEKAIRWSLWQSAIGVKSIVVDINQTTGTSVLKYVSSIGNIYQIADDYSVHSDDGNIFSHFVQTCLYTTRQKYSQHCNMLNLRVVGNGSLAITLNSQDNIVTQALLTQALSATSANEKEVKANFTSTKISVTFTGVGFASYFKLSRMDLYLKPMWFSSPM